MKRFYSIAGAAAVLVASACNDLEVTNPNNPDVTRALASPSDVKNIASSTMNSWYLSSTFVEPYNAMCVTADACTANFGNFGMRFNNLEPRLPYENSSAGGDRAVAEQPWNSNYGTLGAANDVLRAFAAGVVLPLPGETDKFKVLAQFAQAASFMNLALIFDRAFIVDETFDPAAGKPELKPYSEVSAAAMAKWQTTITATSGKSETYDASIIPVAGGLTSVRLNRVANTMAALLLAYTPRNAAEAATVDWAMVASLADKGIGSGSAGAPFNFEVIGDGAINWVSYVAAYQDENTWMRVDQRLINRMDPSIPVKFNGTVVPRGTSPDARYVSDYSFLVPLIGDPGRGIFMQSPWYHSRYQYHTRTSPTKYTLAVPYLLAAESDLVRAEALIRRTTGKDLATAATLINNSRVTRGKLPPATSADGENVLRNYIEYEREIELHATSGFTLFQRRHVDGLQAGTWRHLPIPAKELETLELPIYTFGGVGKPDMNLMLPTGELTMLRSAPKINTRAKEPSIQY
ncbi:MAG: hypothetical protein ABI556_14215 [Gemmatimonadales bacterium]